MVFCAVQQRQHSKAKHGSSSGRVRAFNGTTDNTLSGYAQLDIPRSPRIHGSEILIGSSQYTNSCLSRGSSMNSIDGATAVAAATVATPRTAAAFIEATSVSKVSETANGVRLEDVTLSGFVTEVFAGVTQSEVVCLNPKCKHVSATFERFLDVSLSLNGTEEDEYDTTPQHQQHTTNDDVTSTGRDMEVINVNNNSNGAIGNSIIHDIDSHHRQNQDTAAGDSVYNDDDTTTMATAEHSITHASKGSSNDTNSIQSTANASVPLTRAAAATYNTKAVQLTSLIEGFTAVEQLPHGVKCDTCNAANCMKTKQMSFSSLPLVLIIQLKRFDALTDKKLNDTVAFPLQGLDMRPYMSSHINGNSNTADANASGSSSSGTAGSSDINNSTNSNTSTTASSSAAILYDLHAVINHSGSLSQGHYTCYVQESNTWYECDDTWVCEATEDDVSASQPYILFYRKRGIKGF
jgi:Ubiquitin carboxyl-terminal hydrolase